MNIKRYLEFITEEFVSKGTKLFEALVEDVTFIRMSHTDMLDGREEDWYQPKQRRMIGPDTFNDSLVKAGFPDKQSCVHFMSEESYDTGYSYIYGKNLFQVVIDDKSKLGWSFVAPINDWFYKGNSIQNSLRSGNELVSDIMKSPFNQIYADSQTGEGVDESLNYLLDFKAIGTGTIEDLKKSPHFGKYNLYVWTTDKVYLKKYYIKVKERESKPYKSQPLLTPEDFSSKEEMANFYKTNGSTLKRLKDIMDMKKLDHNEVRQEAIKLLDKWRQTL
jgi:hypothetical protein